MPFRNDGLPAALIALALGVTPAFAQSPGISVGALPQLDAWASGAPSPDGALPPTLWRGSEAAALLTLFDETPRAYGSPAAAALALKALKSSALAPAGDAATAAVRKRYEALGRLGAADALAAMVSGQAASDPAILQFGIQAELARGQDGAACTKAEWLLAADPIPPLALRMRAWCLARAGDGAGAELALDVARQANAADPFVTSAVNALLGPIKAPPAGRFDTSFNAALSTAAKLKPPANALASSSSLALVRIARDGAAAANLRYAAAIIALRSGLIDSDAARAAVRASLQAPAPVAKKGAKPPPPAPVQPLALTLKSVDAAASDGDRARILAAAMRRADAPGAALVVARLFRTDMARIAPRADLADVAAAFAKAALLNGDADAAAAWRALAPATAAPGLDAALAVARSADLSAAIDARIAASAASAPAAARDALALSALGAPLSPTAAAFVKANVPPAAAPADPTKLAGLVDAQSRGALGETALRAANLVGDGAHRLDGASLTTIVQTLRAAGLEADARAIALEALIANLPA